MCARAYVRVCTHTLALESSIVNDALARASVRASVCVCVCVCVFAENRIHEYLSSYSSYLEPRKQGIVAV